MRFDESIAFLEHIKSEFTRIKRCSFLLVIFWHLVNLVLFVRCTSILPIVHSEICSDSLIIFLNSDARLGLQDEWSSTFEESLIGNSLVLSCLAKSGSTQLSKGRTEPIWWHRSHDFLEPGTIVTHYRGGLLLFRLLWFFVKFGKLELLLSSHSFYLVESFNFFRWIEGKGFVLDFLRFVSFSECYM